MDDEEFLLQVLANIEEAEVLTIFFPLLRKALVVDARHTDSVGPMLAIVPQVASMAERVEWVADARPEFGRPEFIMAVPWIKSIRSLGDHGVMERIRSLLTRRGIGPDAAATMTRRTFAELARLERTAMIAMIRGEGFVTLWQADER
jgi:hypothetical protein